MFLMVREPLLHFTHIVDNNGNLPCEHIVFINWTRYHSHTWKAVGGCNTPMKQVHAAYQPGYHVSIFAVWWVWGWIVLIQIRYLHWRISFSQILLRDYRATCQQKQSPRLWTCLLSFEEFKPTQIFVCSFFLLSLILYTSAATSNAC